MKTLRDCLERSELPRSIKGAIKAQARKTGGSELQAAIRAVTHFHEAVSASRDAIVKALKVRPHEGEIRQEASGKAGGSRRAVERAPTSTGKPGVEPAPEASVKPPNGASAVVEAEQFPLMATERSRAPEIQRLRKTLAKLDEVIDDENNGKTDTQLTRMEGQRDRVAERLSLAEAAATKPAVEKAPDDALVPPEAATPEPAEQIRQITAAAAERKAAERLANAPDTSPAKMKVQKAFLLDALDKAVADAPGEESFTSPQRSALGAAKDVRPPNSYETPETFGERQKAMAAAWEKIKAEVPLIQIEVPGDGTFTIVNSKEALQTFRDLAKKKFPTVAAKAPSGGGNLRSTEAKITPLGKPKGAGEFIKIASIATGTDETRFVLLNVRSDGKTVVATDGRRLLMIDAKASGTTEKPVFYNRDLKVVKEPGQYPNFRQVIPDYTKANAVATIDTAAMQKLLAQAMEMQSAQSYSVKLWRDKSGAIGVTSNAPDVGEFAGGSDPTTSKFLAAYQPQFLMDAMKAARALGHEQVTLSLDKKQPEMSPALITAPGMTYVLMPMRMASIGGPEAPNGAIVPTKDRAVKLLEGVLDNKFPQWRTTPKADLPEQAQKLIGQLTKQLARTENDRTGKSSETTGTLQPSESPEGASAEGPSGELRVGAGTSPTNGELSASDTRGADVPDLGPDRSLSENEADRGAIQGIGLDRGGDNRPLADTDANRSDSPGLGEVSGGLSSSNASGAESDGGQNDRVVSANESARAIDAAKSASADTAARLGVTFKVSREAEHGMAMLGDGTLIYHFKNLANSINRLGVSQPTEFVAAGFNEEFVHRASQLVAGEDYWPRALRIWKALPVEMRKAVATAYESSNDYILGNEYVRMLVQVRNDLPLTESYHGDSTGAQEVIRQLAKPQYEEAEQYAKEIGAKLLGAADLKAPDGGLTRQGDTPDIAHIGGPEAMKALKKKLLPGLETLNDIKEGVQSLLLPSAQTPAHLRAAELLGSKLGPMHRRQEASRASFRKDWLTFEKLGVHREDVPLAKNPGIQFMSDIMQAKVIDTKLQAVASRVQGAFAARVALLEKADAPLEVVREHYFPGMWTQESREAFNGAVEEAMSAGIIGEDFNPNDATADQQAWIKDRADALLEQGTGSEKDALRYLTRRPLKGRESFRKQKVFDDIMTGVKFGLRPISPNPIDLVMLKLAEMDKSIMANEVFQALKAKGQLKTVKPAEKLPEGWAKVDDKYGTIYGPRTESGEAEPGKMEPKTPYVGLPILGYRIVLEPVADILNNYLSASLYNNRYFGTLFTGWMGMANALNQTQLGVGSAFHAGFTTMEAQISAGANVVKDVYGLLRGNRSVTDLLKTSKNLFTASIETGLTGDKILNAWRNPDGVIDERIAQVVRAAELAGAGFKLETGLQTDQTSKFVSDWLNGHRLRAARRSPVAFVEMLAKPIMEWIVPRQKAGVFAHLAWRIIEQNPGKSMEELTPEFRQAWNRIDARLGQVRYDRLFINNTAKNVIQGLVRAPGWSGGTIAELGGAFKDTYKFFEDFAKTGKLPEDVPDRVAYTISLLVTVAVLNAALTYALTGDKPEDLDYWAFRTGGKDEHGNPERFLFPTYVKDIIAYVKEPWTTLLNKSHPLLSVFGDLLRNKDFYGVEIRDEDSNALMEAVQAGKYMAKAFTPFWIRGAQKEIKGSGMSAKALLPLIGVMPAPRKMMQTPAQELASKINQATLPAAPMTERQTERRLEKSDIMSKIRRGEAPDIAGAMARGTIKPADVKALYKRAGMSPIAAQVDHMTLENAEKVFQRANLKERGALAPIMARKRKNAATRGRTAFSGF